MSKTLFFGGTILTMDKKNPYAEAIIQQDGKIIAVGKLSDLYEFMEDADIYDLRGKTLMPAFIDGHGHIATTGLNLTKCDLSDCKSFEDISHAIKSFHQKGALSDTDVIHCIGYDLQNLKEKTHPTKEFLDSLGLKNPILCVHASGHVAVFNSCALSICNKQSDTGYFEEDNAFELIARFINITEESYCKAIVEAQKLYIKNGFATLQEGSRLSYEYMLWYKKLADSKKLVCDVVMYMSADTLFSENIHSIIETFGNRVYKNRLKLGGVKVLLDGSPQAKTAWLSKPYENSGDYSGYPIMSDEKLFEIIKRASELDLPTLAHCNGDAACEQFISAYEKLVLQNPKAKSLRPIMIHAQTVTDSQLERMKKIGMMPSFFVGHTWYWGDTHLENLGERAYDISPLGWAQKHNLVYSLHQDTPVTKPDMLHSVWCAATRKTKNGKQLSKEQCISIYEVLIASTYGASYGYFEQNKKGIIKENFVCDLVILDKNPEKCDPRQIKVLSTIKNGEKIY